jgi:DNA-binding XRE family transcriptional regulator
MVSARLAHDLDGRRQLRETSVRAMRCPACHSELTIDGAKVRRIRRERGMTLLQLGNAVGVSVPYLSDIERGNRTARKQCEALATALGVEPVTLLRFEPGRGG